MAQALAELQGKMVSIITNDGRNIVGTLRGNDHSTTIILEKCHERVFSTKAGVEQVALGLYVIRGHNIAVIGELDEDEDAAVDRSQLMAAPIKPLQH
ncbi:unnamed protein product [Chrysoparadoxa australica]